MAIEHHLQKKLELNANFHVLKFTKQEEYMLAEQKEPNFRELLQLFERGPKFRQRNRFFFNSIKIGVLQ